MAQHIIVIGAGIVGASIAFELQRGGAQVSVLDAGQAAATRGSFGWINASFFLNDDHFRLRRDAIVAYRRLCAMLDVPVNWCGCLCFDATGQALDAQAKALDALGYPFQVIDRGDFSALVPAVTLPPERCLKFDQEAATDAGALADRLLCAAVRLGARIIRGVAATGFATTAGRVTGVRTTGGLLAADQIVSAVGTATEALMATVDVPVPMLTRPGVMLQTRPVAPIMDHVLVTPIGEVRQLPNGALIMPAAIDHQRDGSAALSDAIDTVADQALARLQGLLAGHDLAWDQVTLAHRPVPADQLPVAGPVMDGLYVACMHSGVTLAALMGQQIAAEMLHGPSDDTATRLAPYRPGRFAT